MHTCPVCGFTKLRYPVEENPICPSCYTEFGFDDEMKRLGVLRQEWIDAGMPWRGIAVQPEPADWNPTLQVQRLLGFEGNSDTKTSIGQIDTVPWTFVYGAFAESLGVGTR